MELKVTNELKHISEVTENKKYSEAEKKKLVEVSRQFESLLTSMMIKSMNQSTGGMFGEENFGGDFFDSIFQFEIASKMSEGRGLGIANQLFEKLSGEKLQPEFQNIKIRTIAPSQNIKLENLEVNMPSIKPSQGAHTRLSRFEDFIDEASQIYGVDKDLIKSVILAESSANPEALSSANAKGLMQIIDPTAKDLGINNVWNPRENIMGGTKYLSQLLRQYDGDMKLALAGYNAGPGKVEKFKGIPPYKETQNYITRVMGYFNNFKENIYAAK